MKEIQTIKYECSDGTKFSDKEKAQAYELKLWFFENTTTPSEDGKKVILTATGMLDFIIENPGVVIDRLDQMQA